MSRMGFWNSRNNKAKKEHICEMCLHKILPGEIYTKEVGVWDDRFFSRNLHLRCANFEADYCAEVDQEFTWEDIQEYIQEEYCPKCPYYDEEEGCILNESIYTCEHLRG